MTGGKSSTFTLKNGSTIILGAFNFLLILLLLVSVVGGSAIDDLHKTRAERNPKTNEEEPPPKRPDTVCNKGSAHECVCNRSLGDLDDTVILCDRFLEVCSILI